MILVYRTDPGVDFASVFNKPAVYSHETSTDSIQQPRQAQNTQRRLPVYDTQFADQATMAQQTQNSNTHTGPHTHTVGSARDGPLRAPLSRRVAESAQKAHSSSVRENQGGTLHCTPTAHQDTTARHQDVFIQVSLSLCPPHQRYNAAYLYVPCKCRHVQLLLCPHRSSLELALVYRPGLYYSVSHHVHPTTSVYRERPVTRVICATLQSPSRMSDASTSPRHH